jgi:hypothetical protein
MVSLCVFRTLHPVRIVSSGIYSDSARSASESHDPGFFAREDFRIDPLFFQSTNDLDQAGGNIFSLAWCTEVEERLQSNGDKSGVECVMVMLVR